MDIGEFVRILEVEPLIVPATVPVPVPEEAPVAEPQEADA
jgi:hypothetical protein